MKPIIFAAIGAIALSGCSPATTATIAADVKSFCAAQNTASPIITAIVAADGTLLGISSSAKTALATGQQLISINCAALANASATALSPSDFASKMHIDPAIVAKVVKRYSK
jgi:hypothetical protein